MRKNKQHILIEVVGKFLVPFIIIFAFYIQINGSNAPGGGFQAGAVMSAAVVLVDVVFGHAAIFTIFSYKKLKILASVGVFLYMLPGLVSMVRGENFLDYSTLGLFSYNPQIIGITLIEWGVGIAVFASLSMIYLKIATRGTGEYD